MNISRNKLYLFLSVALVSGYIWLYYIIKTWRPGKNNTIDLCLFKNLSGLPCPSCGSTRSVISLIHGNLMESLYINPIGLLIASLMILLPVWILADVIFNKSTFLDFYLQMEIFIRNPKVSFPLMFLLAANWIWNIIKDV